jgi:hypothetical protein
MIGAVVLAALAAGCSDSSSLSPSAEAPLAGDSSLAAAPTDTLLADTLAGSGDSLPPPDTTPVTTLAAGGTGIVFAMMGMKGPYISYPYNGSKYGVKPEWIINELNAARSKGARMVLELASGADSRIQNLDGTFSYTKWKALVDGFRKFNLSSYITDGTLMGHFLIDEPQNARKWGGKIIPQATVEAMAKYSKSIWWNLPTFARVAPTWLAQSTISYVYLDAGWAQYVAQKGDVTKWIIPEIAAAQKKGLGLAVGMNVLDGGNGSSGIRGTMSGKYKMSATEIKSYGTALLNQPYACGFFSWSYVEDGPTYFARTDIKSAMTTLSKLAAAHVKTSCRQ